MNPRILKYLALLIVIVFVAILSYEVGQRNGSTIKTNVTYGKVQKGIERKYSVFLDRVDSLKNRHTPDRRIRVKRVRR